MSPNINKLSIIATKKAFTTERLALLEKIEKEIASAYLLEGQQKLQRKKLNELIKKLWNIIEQENNLLKIDEQVINTQNDVIAELVRQSSTLLVSVEDSIKNCNTLIQLNNSLIKGEEWKPEIQKMIEARKLPVHLN